MEFGSENWKPHPGNSQQWVHLWKQYFIASLAAQSLYSGDKVHETGSSVTFYFGEGKTGNPRFCNLWHWWYGALKVWRDFSPSLWPTIIIDSFCTEDYRVGEKRVYKMATWSHWEKWPSCNSVNPLTPQIRHFLSFSHFILLLIFSAWSV